MVLSTLVEALASLLHTVINIYIWIVIIAALLSFVRPDPYNPIVQVLYRLTNPVYALIRRYVPTLIGGIDLAPLIVILALQFIDLFAVKLLFALANAL
ncbi:MULTISPECIES: YggT family protein [Sulfurospirillum]|uniref:YggT family protein n=1 Tax=unclassified Sulfurospirillum TaxID=2618290 RepID=UPI000541D273|nr:MULTISPECIES: YggT family protein [Sulfurospirillum]KHG32947.1 MAG: membrane protein [Sulfurospirillum sp. MES]MCD8544214.1 YggT family protein [Sulfurospirillum cavolei]MCP3651779.1 YggT family protein [Sulfurospirillum sp. DNRA8]MCR1810626.1 YggT family protein [Sulfurospirillum sp. DNRA8]